MLNSTDVFKEKLLKEVLKMEDKHSIDTDLKECIENTDSPHELYNIFNRMENIENNMKKVHNVLDTISDNMTENGTDDIKDIVPKIRNFIELEIKKYGSKNEYSFNILMDILKNNSERDMKFTLNIKRK